MAFHFSLEALLRFRQSLEDRERLRLEALLGQRAGLLLEMEQLGEIGLALQEQINQSLLQAALPAAEIHFAVARRQAVQGRQQLLRKRLQELQSAIAEQTSRFQQERRRRQALESLREAQQKTYLILEQRREQARLDEMHLLQRLRRRWA